MTTRKVSHNTRVLKTRGGFHISRKPIVRRATDDHAHHVADPFRLPTGHGAPILFAIARDPRTIFVSWNIDWQSVFEKLTPVYRQVHLRVCGEQGLEEQEVAVEPMALKHYITGSQLRGSYRLDIGYYQPADVWHSITMSNEVLMPRDTIVEAADVDLVSMPFHLTFQQLLDSFEAKSDTACATTVSRFQKHALSTGQEALSADQTRILQNLDIPLAKMAKMWRGFDDAEFERLAQRTRGLVTLGATSFSRTVAGRSASAAFS